MTDKRYNIVFEGEIVAGAKIEAVKQNLAKLFRMEPAKVEALFSGKKVVLKKDADQATAMKFRAALKQAGAQCKMLVVGEPEPASAPAAAKPESASSAPAAQAAQTQAQATAEAAPADKPRARATFGVGAEEQASAGDLETVGTIRTGGTGFSGPFDVAPSGTDLADKKQETDTVNPDISHLSMAPPGQELEELPRYREAVNPDISHLSMADDD